MYIALIKESVKQIQDLKRPDVPVDGVKMDVLVLLAWRADSYDTFNKGETNWSSSM